MAGIALIEILVFAAMSTAGNVGVSMGSFGADSNLSWQSWGLFDYRFGKCNSLVFSWRHLNWDYDGGGGDDRFGMDS